MRKGFLLVLLAAFCCFSSCDFMKTPLGEWKRQDFSKLGFSMETPLEFKEAFLNDKLSPDVKASIVQMNTFFSERDENFYSVTTAQYLQGITISEVGAMNGAIQEMTTKAKARVENRKDEEKKINGNKANYTRATFISSEKEKMELQIVIMSKDQRIFQVMGLYKLDKDEVRKMVKRMIGSIELK